MKKLGLGILCILFAIMILAIWNDAESREDFLDEQLTRIENHFENKDIANLNVSKSGVGWHLDHMLKVINTISDSLSISDPSSYKSGFNVQRVFVHTTGYIPRGRAQAPASVTPPEIIELDSLKLQLASVKQNLRKIGTLDKHTYFKHPVFNSLNRDQTRRFLEVHTNHHLKIIADILEE